MEANSLEAKQAEGVPSEVVEVQRLLLKSMMPTFGFHSLVTVKLGNKERFDKEQIGIKELIMDYQPFYTINLLLDKELLPI